MDMTEQITQVNLPHNTWKRRAPAVLAVLLLSVPSALGVQRHLAAIRGDVAGWLAAAGFEMVYLSTSVLLLRRDLRRYAQRTALAAVAVAVVFNSLADYGGRVPGGLVSFALFTARFDGLALVLSIMDSLPLAGLSYAMATLLHRLAEGEAPEETDNTQTARADKQSHETTAPVYALPTERVFSLHAPAQLVPTQIHTSSSSSGEMHPAQVPTDTSVLHRICPVCGVELDTKRYANARRWKRCPACKTPWT
jgi:hypothetical protein